MKRSEWTQADWARLEAEAAGRAAACGRRGDSPARGMLAGYARRVMRHYTTGFFIVSRFLPKAKRDDVELIYAAVRYPDEVVDTFDLAAPEKTRLLKLWREGYEAALPCGSLREALANGLPPFTAAFADLARRHGIPAAYYRSFLDAMDFDVQPRPFPTLDHLVDGYVYGSAVVVGYFLAHVYGAVSEEDFPEAMESARNLGIGLQLTNFLRDVKEDARRGRLYLPIDLLRAHGIDRFDAADPGQREPLKEALREMAGIAERFYGRAEASLDAFHPDSRIAIKACIDVYGMLNRRIAASDRGIDHRESVPLREKLKPLPASKYWRIPAAYLWR